MRVCQFRHNCLCMYFPALIYHTTFSAVRQLFFLFFLQKVRHCFSEKKLIFFFVFLKKRIEIFPYQWYTKIVVRECWNWQTGKTKDLVGVFSCGFKSHLPHQKARNRTTAVQVSRRFAHYVSRLGNLGGIKVFKLFYVEKGMIALIFSNKKTWNRFMYKGSRFLKSSGREI